MGVVTIPRSDVMPDPWKDHEMERGWSPLLTMHDTWAKEPSSMTSSPNERGRRLGGSGWENDKWIVTVDNFSFAVPSLLTLCVYH